jgi:lipoic acid synthetase
LPLDPQEPERLAGAIQSLGLTYAVITMVTRDDCDDGGAVHIAQTITQCKQRCPDVTLEVLVPDFRGDRSSCRTVVASRPDVFSHNIETVPSLFRAIRPGADYRRSLEVLATAAEIGASIPVKSGFMVGLGESEDEVVAMMRDLRDAGVSLLTIGQYLQPGKRQIPVVAFIPPERFEKYDRTARNLGFADVVAGPFVRSSYHAERLYNQATVKQSY